LLHVAETGNRLGASFCLRWAGNKPAKIAIIAITTKFNQRKTISLRLSALEVFLFNLSIEFDRLTVFISISLASRTIKLLFQVKGIKPQETEVFPVSMGE
jgi:hypothetical protein